MKNISVYKTEGVVDFSLSAAPERQERIEVLAFTPIGELQLSTIGFVPVFEDGNLYQQVGDYLGFRIKKESKAEPKEADIERVLNTRLARLEAKGIIDTDYAELYEEVSQDFLRTAKIAVKEFDIFYDFKGERFLCDAPRNTAEEGIVLLMDLFSDVDVALYKAEPSVLQGLLTKWVAGGVIPDKLELGEVVQLGEKTLVGKKPKGANIKINKLYAADDTVKNHIAEGNMVHLVEVGYDGVIYPKIDHTGMYTGITYEEHLNIPEDKEAAPSVNYMSKFTVMLPEVSAMLNTIDNELLKYKESL